MFLLSAVPCALSTLRFARLASLTRSLAAGSSAAAGWGGRPRGEGRLWKPARSAPEVPEQWRDAFEPTPPVPGGRGSGAAEQRQPPTAFGWARKQAPHVPLSTLAKLFRQRQVRLLADGQVKRVARGRELEPGNVLLLPRLPPPGQQPERRAAAAAAAAAAAPAATTQWWQHDLVSESDADSAGEPECGSAPVQQLQQQQLEEERLLERELEEWEDRLRAPHAEEQRAQQQEEQQRSGRRARGQRPQQGLLTAQRVRQWLLASSDDIAVLCKPPGVSLHAPLAQPPWQQQHSQQHDQQREHSGPPAAPQELSPAVAEALGVRPPERPRLVWELDERASGAVLVSRHAAAHQWLSAWVAADPAALAAAGGAAAEAARSAGSQRARGQHQRRLAAQRQRAADAAAGGDVSAKEVAAMRQLFEALGGLRVRSRTFWAVVQGRLQRRQAGTLRNRMLRGDLSLPAATRYRALASGGGLTLVELQPLTNRRNQLRLHCGKALGAPVVGDFRYGYRPWGPAAGGEGPQQQQEHRQQPQQQLEPVPLMLHCREVVLSRPGRRPVRVVAPLPRGMRQLLQDMGWRG